VVSKAAEAMRQIQQSSNRVSEIIGFINRIAFQTNILALNAAVEAARAGDHGKGFNVVAGEVRALAQQAAVAAKEIRALIDGALVNVVEGAEEVGSAGAAMDRIVLSVQKAASIMSEIAEASLEQSAGIEQVSGITVQLNSTTQQNAALVVGASTAARSMQGQAMALALEVGKFQLGDAADLLSQGDSGITGQKEVKKKQRPGHSLVGRGNVVSLKGRPPSPSREH